MANIKILDAFTANRIAAGEVVERPASVVKELVENAIDAQATSIAVEIVSGGIRKIKVTDNGSGIDPEDCLVAFERHATSKIHNPSDIDAIETLGFRGEALSSIAAVAQVELLTRTASSSDGYFVKIHGGSVLEHRAAGSPKGTTMLVENLFYNTPARLEFLKKPAYEAGYVADYIARCIMADPFIAFSLKSDDTVIYRSPGKGDLLSAVYGVYGRECIYSLLPVDYEENGISVKGYITLPEAARPNRNSQSFYVNGRCIQSQQISSAVQEAYGGRLMGRRFPLCVLHLGLPYDAVDVNIHPNKMQVRFKEERAVLSAVESAVMITLGDKTISSWHAPQEEPKKEKERVEQEDGVQADLLQRAPKRPAAPIIRPDIQSVIAARESSAAKGYGVIDLPEEPPAVQPADDSALRAMSVPQLGAQEEAAPLAQTTASQPAPDFKSVESFHVVGQLFSTYILVEQGEDAYLIDQHAAHERILYDKLLLGSAELASQQLLAPVIVTLTNPEYAMLLENQAILEHLGYQMEVRDGGKVKLTAFPMMVEENQGVIFLRDILESLSVRKNFTTPEMRREAIAKTACKRAIKGGDALSEYEIRSLLRQMGDLDELHCPHGRPVIIRVPRREVDKLFGRVL